MPSISAITCVLPKKEIQNDYFYDFHQKDYTDKSNKLTGVTKRYWANEETTLSLCIDAAESLIEDYSKTIHDHKFKSKIDLLVFITQTPESLMPAIGYEAHDRLQLNDSAECLTLNAGCTSYVDGIGLIFDLMATQKFRNALLLVGDVLSKYLDLKDFSTASVFGDAGSATLIKNTNKISKYLVYKNKIPKSSDKLFLSYNNKKNYLKMNGFDVFSFAINNISKAIDNSIVKWIEKYERKPNIVYYLLHQANNMIIEHVIKKMKLEKNEVPKNIHKYANTSGVSIPLLLVSDCDKEKLKNKEILLCGFGVGLSCSVMILNSMDLVCSKIIKK